MSQNSGSQALFSSHAIIAKGLGRRLDSNQQVLLEVNRHYMLFYESIYHEVPIKVNPLPYYRIIMVDFVLNVGLVHVQLLLL